MNLAQRNLLKGIAEYRKVGVESSVETASPHKLIQMLLDGALAKLTLARAYMERREIAPKCEAISWSLAIIEGLKSSLDLGAGGQIAENLDALYDYMMRQLAFANSANDLGKLDEVATLLSEIRSGWRGISPDAANTTPIR